jgi:ATP phosphoribosyltransferase regulatory subunit
MAALLEAPEGTRDLLFDGARRLRACESAVARTFDAAGYDEVIPPTIERSELFEGVAALRASDSAGRSLALRADFTSQVARIAASRLPGRAPLRLWYRGAVVRDVPPGRMASRERFQCGLELLGDASVDADAEVLLLAGRALDAMGLGQNDVRISVGSTAYFAAILRNIDAPPRLANQLRDTIDRKDRAGTAALLGDLPAGRARDALAFLSAPEAQASVLDTARELAPDDTARAAVERLAHVAEAARGLGDRLEIDLGEVRGLGYYTGLVFNIYAAGAPGPIGGGGRYDTLLARFGDPRCAVGFSLDLDVVAPLARLGA